MKNKVKYFSKLFKNIDASEINEPFICLHSNDSSNLPYFEYLVIKNDEFVARFNDLDLAKEYVDYLIKKSAL